MGTITVRETRAKYVYKTQTLMKISFSTPASVQDLVALFTFNASNIGYRLR